MKEAAYTFAFSDSDNDDLTYSFKFLDLEMVLNCGGCSTYEIFLEPKKIMIFFWNLPESYVGYLLPIELFVSDGK